MEIVGVLGSLDGGILGDDAGAGARGIEQAAIESLLDLGDLPPVVRTHDRVGHAHAVQVAHDRPATARGGPRARKGE